MKSDRREIHEKTDTPSPDAPSLPRLDDLKIGDLAKVTGKSARALRLYEEMGLLEPGERTQGGYRLYSHDAIDSVRFISDLQEIGFSLQDLKVLVDEASQQEVPREAMHRVRTQFVEKLAAVEQQLVRLQRAKTDLKDALAYLAACGGCGVSSSGATACNTCDEHGDESAPQLIKGLTNSAKALRPLAGVTE